MKSVKLGSFFVLFPDLKEVTFRQNICQNWFIPKFRKIIQDFTRYKLGTPGPNGLSQMNNVISKMNNNYGFEQIPTPLRLDRMHFSQYFFLETLLWDLPYKTRKLLTVFNKVFLHFFNFYLNKNFLLSLFQEFPCLLT